VVQKVQACAQEKQAAADKDKEMHYAGIRLPEETPMEYGVQDGELDEFANALPGPVKTLVRFTQHPHLIAPVDYIAYQSYGDYGGQIKSDLENKRDVPEDFT